MQQPKRATILGDVIASRQAEDRERLQVRLRQALDRVNETVQPIQALTVTIGDEFQGAFADISRALEASLRLQLELRGATEIRLGLGWGELYFGDESSPYDQDGPCWWRAREALEWIDRRVDSHGFAKSRRTAIKTGTDVELLLNDYLTLRDHVVHGMDAVDSVIVVGLLDGRTQSELANELQLNKSSVSRRVQGHGLLAVVSSMPSQFGSGES